MTDLVATLQREPGDDQGTPGVLVASGLAWNTLELPWRQNRRKLSCVPAGRYRCVWVRSPRFGWVYHVTGVPERTAILIHGGNLAGDATAGWKTHVQGCILLGERRGRLGGQRAVLVSQPAVRRFGSHMGGRPFFLEILDA
jgi:hypothetical protein